MNGRRPAYPPGPGRPRPLPNPEIIHPDRSQATERKLVTLVQPTAGNPMATLQPLRGQTLGTQAADAIRELIVSGQLAGGDRIVEARVAEQLGTSRGPVRDALRLLGQEGLVRDEPRRGTFVVQLTAQDVHDIYDLRIAVETAAVRLVIERGGPDALARIGAAARAMHAAGDDATLAARADLRFHGTVCAASGNCRLYDFFNRHATELLILLRLDEGELGHEPNSIAGEHEDLLAALRPASRPRKRPSARTSRTAATAWPPTWAR